MGKVTTVIRRCICFTGLQIENKLCHEISQMLGEENFSEPLFKDVSFLEI